MYPRPGVMDAAVSYFGKRDDCIGSIPTTEFPIAKLEPSLTNNIVEEMNGTCAFLLEEKNIERYLASGEYNISITVTLQNLDRLIFAEKVAKFEMQYSMYTAPGSLSEVRNMA